VSAVEDPAAAVLNPAIAVDSGESPWQRLLGELDHVPAHDPRWDTVADFNEKLRELAARKVKERQFAIDLEGRIKRLDAHPRRPSAISLPSVSGLDVTLWSQLDELSNELIKQLDELDKKIGAMPAATLDNVRRLLDEAGALSRRCEELWDGLSRLSGGGAQTRTAPLKPEPESPLADPEAEALAVVEAAPPAPAPAEEEAQVAVPETPAPAEPKDAAPPAAPEAYTVAEPAQQDALPTEIMAPESPAAEAAKAESPEAEEVPPVLLRAVSAEQDEWAAYPTVEVGPATTPKSALQVLAHPEDVGCRGALLDGLLAEGYWSEAYWLAYSLALDPRVPEGVRDECSRLETLLNFLLATISVPVSREQSLAVVHASPVYLDQENERVLGFMIAIAGFAGTLARPLRVWLEYRPKDSPSLIEVAEYLQKLHLQLPLSTEDVSACTELSVRQKEIESLRVELDGWRRDTPRHADWQVWARLAFKEPRPLRTMVDSTLNSAANPPEQLMRDVRQLQSDSKAKTLISEYDNAGYRQMHSSMLRNLSDEITTLAGKCHQYLERVVADRDARLLLTADLVKLAEFRKLIASRDEAVVAELNRCIEASPTPTVRSAWLAGLRLWRWLTGVLDIDDSRRGSSLVFKSLYLNRNAALALYPIERDDLGGIDSEFLQDSHRMASIFATHLANPPAQGDLVKRITATGDFRFIEDLRAAVREEQGEDTVVQDLERELQRIRAELAAKRVQAETAITRAWALGFIDEGQKARFESIIGEVGPQHSATRFLRPVQEAVGQILASLTEKETAWVKSLNADLDAQIRRLRERHVDEDMVRTVEAARTQVESRFPEAAHRCAALSDLLECTRAAANCDNTEDAAKRLGGIGSSALIPRYLSAFLSSKPSPSTSWAGPWDALQSAIKNAPSEYAKRGHEILRRIGIQEQQIGTPARNVMDYGNGKTGACGILEVRAVGPSAIPQFGSGLTRLKLAIDGNPDGDLTVALTELAKLGEPAIPAVILYVGRLTLQQRPVRNTAASLAPEAQRSTTVVIDRTLWEYLEPFERLERLSVMLHCALPFTYANPFRAFGYVPKELFVGRGQEIEAIAGEAGRSRLLYGGRQFGKSAILQEVQRQVDSNEGRGRRCLLLDLRNKFRTQPPSNIWSEIRRAFAEKIRPKATGSASPDTTIAYIRTWLDESPSNKLIVLADEADSFLRADARRAYEESSKIAALMRDTRDRFRMIFAGTIDVGRHAASKNAPLNEFGDPVIVLPALPRDARRMLEVPLAALGIYLNESDVYQILARTNYYPGLIQFIGEKIVELNVDSSALPPAGISSDRIAKLLEQDSVRRMMIERFGLTLGLTDDYKCIIYSLVQKQSGAGMAVNSLSEDKIYQSAVEAWPRRFSKMPLNEFNVILQELMPMGVLVRDQDGYRLRSPNLVPLLGSPAELATVLKGLERQAVDNLDDFHCIYDKDRALFSPLSQAQETLITGESHPINLVLTPNAAQWNAVVESLRSNRDEQFDFQVEIPAEALADYQSWYANEDIAKRTEAKRITLIANLVNVERDSMPARLEALVADPRLVRHRTVTFVIGLPGNAALRYLSFDESRRAQWEKERDLIAVRRWTLDQIRVALSDLELTSTYEVGQHVERVTGGWHFLLTQLFESWQRRDSPQDNLAAFSMKIESHMGEAFLASMGLEGEHYRETVSLLHAGEYIWKEFDAARVAQDGAALFDAYEPPPDLRAFVEYLVRLDVAPIVDGRIRVEPLTVRLCGVQR